MGTEQGPAPALLVFRSQLDAWWPTRERQSDGIMGDARHRLRPSAHNRGDALDVTNSPRGPNLHVLTEDLRRQMLAAPAGRLRLIIFNGRICSARHEWRWRRYWGRNPHRTHAHFEVEPSRRALTRMWTLRG
jgi:hypothetical protein